MGRDNPAPSGSRALNGSAVVLATAQHPKPKGLAVTEPRNSEAPSPLSE